MRTSNNLIGMLNFVTFLLSIPILGGGIWLSTRANNTDCLAFLQWPLIIIGVAFMVVSLAGFAGACYRNTFLMYLYLWAMFFIIATLLGFVIFAYVVTDKGSGRAVLNRGYQDYYLPDYSGWLKDRVASDAYWRKISSCIRDSNVCRKTGRATGEYPETADTYYLCGLSPIELALVGGHAVTPDVYWKSVLPNSPMPKAVTDLLPEWDDEKNTAVGVGKGGVAVNTGKPGKRTYVGVDKGGVAVNTRTPGKGTSVGVGKGGVGVHTGKPGKRTDVGVGKGGVSVHTGHKGKPVYVGVHKGNSPFIYQHAASEDQLKDDPNVALFFLENDLHQGAEMNLHFTKTENQKSTFLPKKVADSIPFSSDKLPQIYNEFSVEPESTEAEIMKQTLSECENKGIEGEEKYCATSLESMVDFSTTKLGKNVKAISTEVDAKLNTPLQKYKIKIAKKLAAKKAVVCHKQNYAYAVFYCHKTISTRAYAVSMVGTDGTKVKAVAVCHTDTAKWNPKHFAFQVLKVKPGSVPICHFLPEDHVVWVPY